MIPSLQLFREKAFNFSTGKYHLEERTTEDRKGKGRAKSNLEVLNEYR